MNLTKLALMSTALCTCLSLPLAASDDKSADEDAQSVLKELRHEIMRLRAKVAELEARLKRMEAAREIMPATPNRLREMSLRRLKQVLELEPQRSNLPLGGDKGLYVFPGIDAPPLTPMDALRTRTAR